MNKLAKCAMILGASFFMGSAYAAGDSAAQGATTGTDTGTGMTDTQGGAQTGTMSDTMGDPQNTQSTRSPQVGQSERYPGTAMDQASGSQGQVRDAQSALSSRGYDLQVDGILGNNTKNALMRFQRDQGLEETGRLDSATIRALNLQSTDRQPASVTDDMDLDTNMNQDMGTDPSTDDMTDDTVTDPNTDTDSDF